VKECSTRKLKNGICNVDQSAIDTEINYFVFQLAPFVAFVGESVFKVGHFKGTIFRFPLRDRQVNFSSSKK
jgi:hypothetical protein